MPPMLEENSPGASFRRSAAHLLPLLLIPLFLFFLLSPETSGAAVRPRVLLISSYHPGFPTFFSQVEGIRSVFGDAGIDLDVEFMDSKRFYLPENLENFTRLLSWKLSRMDAYDAVMTGDDNALHYALKHHDGLLRGAPLVFFGVNDLTLALRQNTNARVTGVVEAVSMRETLALMRKLTPGLSTITALVDASPSGRADLATFYRESRHFEPLSFSHISLSDLSLGGFAKKLGTLDEKSAVLLLSAYRDKAGNALSFSDSLRLIRKNLKAPLYHLWHHGMGEGVLGGKLISHFEQGKTAAAIVRGILSGKATVDFTVTRQSPNRYFFDFTELSRFGIDLSALPKESVVINKPQSFYWDHKGIVRPTTAALVLFALLLSAMAISILHLRRTKEALRKSERNAKELFTQSPVGLALCRMDGQLASVNPAYAAIIGRSVTETMALTYWDITPEIYAPQEELQLASLRASGRYGPYEKEYIHRDGHLVPVLLSGLLLEVDGEPHIWSSVEDITPRKRAEDKLRKLNEALDEMVRSKTADLRQTIETLESTRNQLLHSEKMASLGGLVAGLSHEINTPLGIAITGTSFIEEKCRSLSGLHHSGKLTRSRFEAHLEEIRETAEGTRLPLNQAAELIRSFKQVAVDQTSEQKRRFDLKTYTEEVLASLAPEYRRTGHTITVEGVGGLTIESDPGAIMQILTNLVMNSLLHGFKEIAAGHVTITLSEAEGGIRIHYLDDGRGMTEAVRERIFDPFYTTAKEAGGTGLGLHIVFNLVTQRLKGSIACKSAIGRGTEFFIEFPR